MTVLKKNPGTCGSTALPNVAYKPSWSENVAPTTPGLHNGAPLKQAGTPKLRRMSMISTARAARCCASLTSSAASAPFQLWELPLPSF
jgi:hypothetical protein